MYQFSYPFICQWTSRLLPCPDYYKQCCNEHWGTCGETGFWLNSEDTLRSGQGEKGEEGQDLGIWKSKDKVIWVTEDQ